MTRITRRTALALPFALAAPAIPRAQGAVDITVHYAQPFIFKPSYDAITEAFARIEPGIRINYVNTPNYQDGAQLLLRQAATNQLPDLSYQGLNLLRVFAERGIAQDLGPLIARDGDPAAQGFTPGLLSLGRHNNYQAGLAYAASTAISFINADLVRSAGFDPDNLPQDWDGHLRLAAAVKARSGGPDGMWFAWSEWMFQTLVLSHAGAMMTPDESDIAFEGAEGLATLKLHERMVAETAMPALNANTASQAFAAGRLGAFYWTTAVVRNTINSVGSNFDFRTYPLPVVAGVEGGTLATGGSAGMITARDPAKREAAWKFLRFTASAQGQALMAMNSGYVPCNQLAIDDPRWLADFYRANPRFGAAVAQMPRMAPWFAFPGANGVRITEAINNNTSRVIERRATPEVALADMARDVRRLLPRRS
ncbi:extracellular solute-binding protein [Falsiroseomonas sp. E2-1-a4]|uniref:extracellular solute-binding protein n=1 Tax=Falsiroseomonas sp. E2-1-a4 TaxID=3239299 RepID=UPI003F3A7E21